MFKPFNPDVLRSKVAVFIELHEKNKQLRRQAEQLKEQELAELRRESEERYRFLAESQPDQIWTAQPNGELDYVNQRAIDYFDLPFSELVESGWMQGVHPEDIGRTLERWRTALATGLPYETEFRLRRASDGAFRWHLTRAVAMTGREGGIVKWFGSNTDIHDQKRAEEAQRFLVEAGAALAGSLDYRSTLAAVARLAVPRIADWARVDVIEAGKLRTAGRRARRRTQGRARLGARAPLPGTCRRAARPPTRSPHRQERARRGDQRRAARGARDRRPPPGARARARGAELHVRPAHDARRGPRA